MLSGDQCFLDKTLWQGGRPQPLLADESATMAADSCIRRTMWKIHVPALHHWKIIVFLYPNLHLI